MLLFPRSPAAEPLNGLMLSCRVSPLWAGNRKSDLEKQAISTKASHQRGIWNVNVQDPGLSLFLGDLCMWRPVSLYVESISYSSSQEVKLKGRVTHHKLLWTWCNPLIHPKMAILKWLHMTGVKVSLSLHWWCFKPASQIKQVWRGWAALQS